MEPAFTNAHEIQNELLILPATHKGDQLSCAVDDLLNSHAPLQVIDAHNLMFFMFIEERKEIQKAKLNNKPLTLNGGTPVPVREILGCTRFCKTIGFDPEYAAYMEEKDMVFVDVLMNDKAVMKAMTYWTSYYDHQRKDHLLHVSALADEAYSSPDFSFQPASDIVLKYAMNALATCCGDVLELNISRRGWDNFWYAHEILFHEMRHRYKNQIINALRQKELPSTAPFFKQATLFIPNDAYYVHVEDDPLVYPVQPLELDAQKAQQAMSLLAVKSGREDIISEEARANALGRLNKSRAIQLRPANGS